MRERDVSQVEAIVAAVEAKATPTMQRTKGADLRRERLSGVVSEEIERLPVDRTRLEAAAREDREERRRNAHEARRRAVEASPETAEMLNTLATSSHGALGVNPADWEPGSFVEESVDFIRSWPTPENLRDSHVGQLANWAEYAVTQSGDSFDRHFSERVSFYTMWRNPRQTPIVATVLTRLKVNGHCSCDAEWGGVASWFFDDSLAHVDVSARLTLWGLWTEPAPRIPVANALLASITAKGGFFGDDDATSIGAAPLLIGAGFPIPAREWILIEASVVSDYELLDGSVDLDFTSGAFRVECTGSGVVIPSAASAQA